MHHKKELEFGSPKTHCCSDSASSMRCIVRCTQCGRIPTGHLHCPPGSPTSLTDASILLRITPEMEAGRFSFYRTRQLFSMWLVVLEELHFHFARCCRRPFVWWMHVHFNLFFAFWTTLWHQNVLSMKLGPTPCWCRRDLPPPPPACFFDVAAVWSRPSLNLAPSGGG